MEGISMAGKGRLVEIYFGPQHPGVPGNIAFKLTLDGERVVNVETIPGFLHRGFEKMMENRTWEMNVVLSYRFCVEDPDPLEIAYAMAVEKIHGVEIPENAKYIRMIQAEFSRIASHLFWSHFMGGSTGLRTPAYWALVAREEILKWFARFAGHRVYHNISVPGGVRYPLPESFVEDILRLTDFVEEKVRDTEAALLKNSIFRDRTRGVGRLSIKEALELGVTGPVLRAAGLPYDLRKVTPYLNYDKVRFEVPTIQNGDAYDRSVLRFREIYESLKIIRESVKRIDPEGGLRVKLPLTAPPGEGVARVETARGEYMIHIISTGGRKPYRIRLKSMSLPLMTTVVEYIVKRDEVTIADFPILLASLDPCPPDIDR
ncbi:MAG: NADH dehydrogenase subunit D [Desulfurococcus sp.]|jgi:NADH-quinone oxidoreductase subunit D|uniref:NADH-quinone oxidoreductase subunit D n=2 Tax=Desulfurococcus sp. TaxID=51678 RepID=UPI00316363FA